MQMRFSTIVGTPVGKVIDTFDKKFFEKLTPGGLPFKIIRFDGVANQDKYHIKIGVGALLPLPSFKIGKQSLYDWEGVICEIISDDGEYGFIDEGIVLPFPLKEWRHVHRFKKHSDDTTEIIDDITFSTWAKPFDALVSPAILGLFAYRKMIYLQAFGRV